MKKTYTTEEVIEIFQKAKEQISRTPTKADDDEQDENQRGYVSGYHTGHVWMYDFFLKCFCDVAAKQVGEDFKNRINRK